MLITERSPHNTHASVRVQTATRTLENPLRGMARRTNQQAIQTRTGLVNLAQLLSKLGDRQAWLLLVLVMIPVIGMIRNFLAFGFER
jgi:hypothetical protein